MHYYECYGLGLESEPPLPIPERPRPGREAEIVVRSGGFEAPGPDFQLPYDVGGALYCVSRNGGIIVRVKGSADFLVTESSIRIGESDETEAVVGDLVLRVALGFVLQLRSKLCFHGAAVSSPPAEGRRELAVAVLGDKGAGKSTTALGLAQRGWGLLCDDLLLVEADGLVPQGVAQARLNADSFDRLMGGLGAAPPLDRDGKHPVAGRPGGGAAPLKLVFVIGASEVEGVELEESRGYKKLGLALGHLNSPRGIGEPRSRLLRASEALSGVALFEARRPKCTFALEELLDAIERVSLKEDR